MTVPPGNSLDDDELPPADADLRQRRWRVRSDPRALWPDVEPNELQPAADEIGRAVAVALQGGRTSLGRADGRDARALGVAGLLTGVGPLLGAYVDAGLLDVHDDVARGFARHLAHGRRRIERIRREVMPVLRDMVSGGVAPAVMKGFHTAHLCFPEPGARPLSDVDVVVAPADIARAEGILHAAGFESPAAAVLPYKRNWVPRGSDARVWSFDHWDARSPWSLELHDGLNFDHATENACVFRDAAAFSETWSALGVPLRVSPISSLLAIQAMHASGELYVSRLLRLVEVILIARHGAATGELDWHEVEEPLSRTGALRFAYPAFALAERLVPGTIDSGMLARARGASTTRARSVTDQLTSTSQLLVDGFSLTQRLMWAKGWRQVARKLGTMVLPRPELSLRESVRVYHVRLRRLISGRVTWRARTGGPTDAPLA